MKKTHVLLASVCSIVLLGALSPASAEPISFFDPEYLAPTSKASETTPMPYTTTGAANTYSDIKNVSDLTKYIEGQSYQNTNLELGNLYEGKFNGSWDSTGQANGYSPSVSSSAFETKYQELKKQLASLQSNGSMDPTERDKQLTAIAKQIKTYDTANLYNQEKLILSTKYGVPMSEIDSMLAKLADPKSGSYQYSGYYASNNPTYQQPTLQSELGKTLNAYNTYLYALQMAGIDPASSTAKLLQNNSMIDLQTSTLSGLAGNTIYQAGNWTKEALEKGLAQHIQTCQMYANQPKNMQPQDCALDGHYDATTKYSESVMAGYSEKISKLFGQTGDLYGETVDLMKAQYDEIKATMDEEYLAMKEKVAQGLATNEDLYALMDEQKEMLASYEGQIDFATSQYEDIQSGMMNTLISKGYTESAFFTGNTSFSGSSGLSNFFGGSSSLASVGGGTSGGGSGGNPLVNHGG